MGTTTSKLTVGYPVFTARFKDEKTVVIGGGGGEGKNGVANKISVLKVDQDALKIESEIELPTDEDCPMSLDVLDNTVYAGVNRSEKAVAEGNNDHLRILNLKKGEQAKTKAVFPGDAYQKCTCVSETMLVIGTSDPKSKIYTMNLRSQKPKMLKQLDGEVNDLVFSDDGKRLLCTLDKQVVELDATTGKQTQQFDLPREGCVFARARYCDEKNDVTAAVNIVGRKGSILCTYDDKGGVVKQTQITKKGAVVCMDVSEQFVALGTSDLNLHIYKTQKLAKIKTFNNIHSFAITDVTISDDESTIVTVSADNTVYMVGLSDGEFHSWAEAIVRSVLIAILLAVIAYLLQLVVNRELSQVIRSRLTSSGFGVGASDTTGQPVGAENSKIIELDDGDDYEI